MSIHWICNTQHAQFAPGEQEEHVTLQAETRCAAAGPQCLKWDSSEQRRWRDAHCTREKSTISANISAYSMILPHMQQTKIACIINCSACKNNMHFISQEAYTRHNNVLEALAINHTVTAISPTMCWKQSQKRKRSETYAWIDQAQNKTFSVTDHKARSQ